MQLKNKHHDTCLVKGRPGATRVLKKRSSYSLTAVDQGRLATRDSTLALKDVCHQLNARIHLLIFLSKHEHGTFSGFVIPTVNISFVELCLSCVR